MDQRTTPPLAAHGISRGEFIAIVAALMATNALAVDIMLPGLQQIGESLGVANENHRQYVLTAYLLGFGVAQLAYGPITDRFGRRPPLIFGLILYTIAAFASAFAPDFASLLALRAIQGVGAAATRVIAVSVVRDVFGGRQMAEVMSLVFMVFMIVPVIAPSAGQLIMLFAEWHMIFVLMGLAALVITVWTLRRLPETMHPENRRPLTIASVAGGFKAVLSNRMSFGYTIASMLFFGGLFGFINSAQQIYVEIYGLGAWFPVIFAVIAGMMALSSFLNSRLVGRIGMRRLSHGALCGFFGTMTLLFLLSLAGPVPFPIFLALFALSMVQFGWIGSNFNALAMEPLGHVAGTASSVQGFLQTIGGAAIGASIGQAYNGTVTPLAAGFSLVSLLALGMVAFAEKGKLFRQYQGRPTP